MTSWIIITLLALILIVQIQIVRYVATLLAELRTLLDEQPSRIAKREQQEAELRERWTTEARASARDPQDKSW